jgi:hypothetical protein
VNILGHSRSLEVDVSCSTSRNGKLDAEFPAGFRGTRGWGVGGRRQAVLNIQAVLQAASPLGWIAFERRTGVAEQGERSSGVAAAAGESM